MATLLERRFTHLDDSLLTAVLPADETQGETFYSEMYRRTCREAENRITTLRLDDIFDRRPLRRVETAAALLLVGITLFGSLFPDLMKIWGHRSLALSTDIWPRHTRLALIGFTNGVRKVARGSDVEIVVGADTFMPKIPSTVEIRYREEGGVRGRATMQRVGSADPAKDPFQEYSYTRRNVLSPLSFDVYGGDDSLKENRIEVVDSPTVTQWMLECTYPTYMERPVRSFSGSGIMQLPFGTSVSPPRNSQQAARSGADRRHSRRKERSDDPHPGKRRPRCGSDALYTRLTSFEKRHDPFGHALGRRRH